MLPRERLRRSGVMGDLYIHTRLGRFSFANVARMCAAVAASRVAARTHDRRTRPAPRPRLRAANIGVCSAVIEHLSVKCAVRSAPWIGTAGTPASPGSIPPSSPPRDRDVQGRP